MSDNCINCITNKRTGSDLLCDQCRKGVKVLFKKLDKDFTQAEKDAMATRVRNELISRLQADNASLQGDITILRNHWSNAQAENATLQGELEALWAVFNAANILELEAEVDEDGMCHLTDATVNELREAITSVPYKAAKEQHHE